VDSPEQALVCVSELGRSLDLLLLDCVKRAAEQLEDSVSYSKQTVKDWMTSEETPW
jgi:hypothetical protein